MPERSFNRQIDLMSVRPKRVVRQARNSMLRDMANLISILLHYSSRGHGKPNSPHYHQPGLSNETCWQARSRSRATIRLQAPRRRVLLDRCLNTDTCSDQSSQIARAIQPASCICTWRKGHLSDISPRHTAKTLILEI